MDQTQNFQLAGLATLSAVFRKAVQDHFAQDDAFQAALTKSMDMDLLQTLAVGGGASMQTDGSRESYTATLVFNERVLSAYAQVAGDEPLRAQLPEGQASRDQQALYMQTGCPTLARLHAPKPAAAS